MGTATAGSTLTHCQIAINFSPSILNFLLIKDQLCITYGGGVKVHIALTRETYFPNISVVCNKPQTSKKDPKALINPILAVTIL